MIMPRIADIIQSVDDMTHEKITEHVIRIREGRLTPIEKKKTKKAKKKQRKVANVKELILSLSPEEKAALIKNLKLGG